MSRFLLAFGLFLFFTGSAAKSTGREPTDANDEQTAAALIRDLRLAHSSPSSSSSDAPWISGPHNKKFQFHVGLQSWLGARETCLAENADLLTIGDPEELDWVLSHYKPQLRAFRERQLQLGLLASEADDEASGREWRWVNETPLNATASGIRWIEGEPFDHAEGRERCALLNVNTRRLEDVDCDLSGNPANFYRFVCERTHERHLKHEELNNPLWKKLEDILVFFGISRPSNASDDADSELIAPPVQEDYEEEMTNNSTAPVAAVAHDEAAGSGEEPAPAAVQTLNDGPPPPSTAASSAAHGTKISEPTANDADLLTGGKLEKISASMSTQAPESTTVVAEVASTTADSLQRTTASDPLAHLADTIETAARDDGKMTAGDRMHHLERIINAVQTMLEDESASNGKKAVAIENSVTASPQPSGTSEAVEVVQLVDRRVHDESERNVVDAGRPDEQVIAALNVEGDFERAQVEARAHPNTNSGDFLLAAKQDELVGCGAKNLGATRPPTASPAAPTVDRATQVEQLISSLRTLLHGSSPELLEDLVASGNDTRTLLGKLQSAAANSTASEMRKGWMEDKLAEELEELGEVESQEFVEGAPADPAEELMAIGSGLDPPTERLVTLVPITLTAKQQAAAKNATDEGFDVNVKLHLPAEIPEKESAEKEDEDAQFKIAAVESSEEAGGSGDSWEDSEEVPAFKDKISVFPRPDFSLVKNEKKAAAAKKRLAAEKQRADRAFAQLNAADTRSLADRIRESEARRQNAAKLREEDLQTAEALKSAFDEWISWAESR